MLVFWKLQVSLYMAAILRDLSLVLPWEQSQTTGNLRDWVRREKQSSWGRGGGGVSRKFTISDFSLFAKL